MQKEYTDKQIVAQQNPEHLQESQDVFSEALAVVSDLHTQPAFLKHLHDNGVSADDTTSSQYAQLLTQYGNRYCDTHADIYTPEQVQAVKLLASAPDAIHSHKRLGEISHIYTVRRPTKAEYSELDELKPRAITYNHMLSNYIRQHGDTQFDDLTHALASASLDSFPNDPRGAIHAIIELTRGAQAEATASDTVKYRPDIFQLATEDEDRTGSDQIIHYGNRAYGLDIKVSNYAILELRQAEVDDRVANGTMTADEATTYINKVKTGSINYALRYHKNTTEPTIVICMDVIDSDYQGKCQLSQDVAEGKINQMLAQAQRAVTEVKTLHP